MTLIRSLAFIALTAGLLQGWARGAEVLFVIKVDYSEAPECKEFAEKSQTLAEEWYPKINEILFGKGHPLPTKYVNIKFQHMEGVAHTTHDGIHISAEWIAKQPNDYGMVIHELTHVVQAYNGGGEGWVTEGIADYIRHQYYEKDGDQLKKRVNPVKSSYHQKYTIAAAFLIWLEENKDKELVHKLNAASHDHTYKKELFVEYCGADVDTLWKEFVDSLRKPKA